MNNSKKKTKQLNYTLLMGIALLGLMVSIFAFNHYESVFAADNMYDNRTMAIDLFDNAQIKSIEYLYNFNDSPDFIYTEFEYGGYAVYFRENLELLEYSLEGNLPFNNSQGVKYYGGPASYFTKQEEVFVDILTGNSFNVSVAEQETYAQELTSKFVKDTGIEQNDYFSEKLMEIVAVQSGGGTPIDAEGQGSSNRFYIDNYEYFKTYNPRHGYNSTGTCGAVAAQLLLSYNNYYNDRRIIASEYLNSTWDKNTNTLVAINTYPEQDPNQCTDLRTMNREILGTSGYNEGDVGTYFNLLVNKIPASATSIGVQNGLKSILNAKSIKYNSSMDFNLFGTVTVDTLPVIGELTNNRPAIVSTVTWLGGYADHYMVAYGYENLNSAFGFIVHYGHSGNTAYRTNIWVNANWCNSYITLKINHTHNYSVYESSNYETELRCECGHRNTLFNTTNIGTSAVQIDSANFSIAGSLTIPTTTYGKTVTVIGASAFANQMGLTSITLPSSITHIGNRAFQFCSSLSFVDMDSTSVTTINDYTFDTCPLDEIYLPNTLKIIGEGAFIRAGVVGSGFFTIPDNVTNIGDYAFMESKLTPYELPHNLMVVGDYAFKNARQASIAFDGDSALRIGTQAFYNSGLIGTATVLTQNVFTSGGLLLVGSEAFAYNDLIRVNLTMMTGFFDSRIFIGNENLTIYCERNEAPYLFWASDWNSSNIPVLWNCTFSSDNMYVESFTKMQNGLSNISAHGDFAEPYLWGYTFKGWYTDVGGAGTKINDITTLSNGTTVYTYFTKTSSSCVATGTLITLADGRQVPVETLTGNELLLVWNMLTGTFDFAPIVFIDSDAAGYYEVINLTFSDGTTLKIIYEHALWDFNLNKYVFLRNDASQYIGHWFNKQTADSNGNLTWTSVQLVGVSTELEYTTAWSPVTFGHLCYYVNGMLSMPGATEGLVNIFDVNGLTMQYDAAAMFEDIQQYGLFAYEEFAAVLMVSEVVFEAFNGQYLKVAMGKGLLNWETLADLVETYANFFENLA